MTEDIVHELFEKEKKSDRKLISVEKGWEQRINSDIESIQAKTLEEKERLQTQFQETLTRVKLKLDEQFDKETKQMTQKLEDMDSRYAKSKDTIVENIVKVL